jgi:Ca2+/Na+ antiporter
LRPRSVLLPDLLRPYFLHALVRSTDMSIETSTTPSGRKAGSAGAEPLVDPRALRLVAAITTAVLALVLVTGNGWLLAAQALVFALGAFDQSPYGLLFRRFVRPRLGPPKELEDARPPRFAQLLGLTFAVAGVIGFALGSNLVGLTATALALAAAFLNAAFGVCLGCELYLLFRRTFTRGASALHKEGSA